MNPPPFKKPLKAGDRVSGDWNTDDGYKRVRGWLGDVTSTYAVIEPTKGTGVGYKCAPNSVKRLRPKNRREFWMLVDKSDGVRNVSIGPPDMNPDEAVGMIPATGYTWIRVREVKK